MPTNRSTYWIGRAKRNVERAGEEPGRILDSFLGLLPAALFLLMPLFALMLKVFYIGKRWLYTAHLVVALKNHSFVVMGILVSTLLGALSDTVAGSSWLYYPAAALQTASRWWAPVYLLIMQRRVYQQGWLVTLPKFAAIGTLYGIILGLTVTVVAIIGLVLA